MLTFLIGLLPMSFSNLSPGMPSSFADTQIISTNIYSSAVFLAATNLKIISSTDLKDIDAHALKEDFVGKSEVSKFDIYVDNNGRGKIVLVKKSDTKVQVETGLTVQQAKDSY